MLTDPIADMLMRIRNATRARHQRVDVPASKLKIELARILKEEGYIGSYKLVDENSGKSNVRKSVRIVLKYTPGRRSIITGLRRVSRPGSRVFAGKLEIRPVFGGLGTTILSTPRGLMTGRAARKAGVGGEVLCEVW